MKKSFAFLVIFFGQITIHGAFNIYLTLKLILSKHKRMIILYAVPISLSGLCSAKETGIFIIGTLTIMTVYTEWLSHWSKINISPTFLFRLLNLNHEFLSSNLKKHFYIMTYLPLVQNSVSLGIELWFVENF